MDPKQQAKNLLAHYFTTLARQAGIPWTADNTTEIENIVDHIIAAAVAQANQHSLQADAAICNTIAQNNQALVAALQPAQEPRTHNDH